ncbi:efflux RND transporter periplasmic adaptor subunit [Lichenifustis flavocetrariae]|uniref:Efflux RND transporter periplasmic adaptor subunit n=1 Tax=Lichenifustis flavocetrariae TaxID=2949735 RepID=A0AA42CNK4_9HYPH|nr:efflux RND transporter periplasmic adaptor subunit [Lichenifustis flavocetrariae]MCW6509470.1 efflux RND transporter periplasmic adaptor subunit [Lichenifustis flavocetrariae]
MSRSFGRPCAVLKHMGAVLAAFCTLTRAASADGSGADLVRVRAAVPVEQRVSPDLALTGTIQPRIQTNIAFRVNGKVTTRRVEVGQHVGPDDVLASLDPVEQQADVDNATAALDSVKAQLQQAELTFGRQQSLLSSGYTTRASFDQAQETLNTARAQVNAAQAALNTAREQQSYTELKAGQSGIIVSRDIEAGQVVQSGQTAFVLAQDGPRDAVFEIPETLLTAPPSDKSVDIALQANPEIHCTGSVREISPLVDPGTGTVTVKIGLDTTPPEMTLGAVIVGRAHWEAKMSVVLPWSALFEIDRKPAVWVLDDQNRVSLKTVTVRGYMTGSVFLADGLSSRQRVVTAGVQLLYPGQTVDPVQERAP